MTLNERAHAQIREFETHWRYDASYLHVMIDEAPAAYEAFDGFWKSMGSFRGKAPAEVRAVAQIAANRHEDCGPCLQLGVKMALEAGVDREIVRAAVQRPQELPPKLRRIYDFALAVASNADVVNELRDQVLADYGSEITAEVGIYVVASRTYPTLKRAFGMAKSCSLVQIDV
jgi:alkylhydroperoxidase family enzyme